MSIKRDPSAPSVYRDRASAQKFFAQWAHVFAYRVSDESGSRCKSFILPDGSRWHELSALDHDGYELREDLSPSARLAVRLRAYALADIKRRAGLQDLAEIAERAREVCELVSRFVDGHDRATPFYRAFCGARMARIAEGRSPATFESVAALALQLFNTGALAHYGLGGLCVDGDLREEISFAWHGSRKERTPVARIAAQMWCERGKAWEDLPPVFINLEVEEVY